MDLNDWNMPDTLITDSLEDEMIAIERQALMDEVAERLARMSQTELRNYCKELGLDELTTTELFADNASVTKDEMEDTSTVDHLFA